MEHETGKFVITVRRHEKRQRDSEGNKLEHLTEEGFARARHYGEQIPRGYCTKDSPVLNLLAYHSKETRAKETAESIAAGFNDWTGVQDEVLFDRSYKVGLAEALNPYDFSKNPDYEKAMRACGEYDAMMNFLLQNPDPKGQTETMEECGQRIIQWIRQCEGMFEGYRSSGQAVHIENVTHGPVIEAALVQLVEPGLKDIKLLHGGFREGEAFRLEYSGPQSKLYFRGECVNLR